MVDSCLTFVHQLDSKAVRLQLSLENAGVGGYLFQIFFLLVTGTVRIENDVFIDSILTEELVELPGKFRLFVRIITEELLQYPEFRTVVFLLTNGQTGEMSGIITDEQLVALIIVLQVTCR